MSMQVHVNIHTLGGLIARCQPHGTHPPFLEVCRWPDGTKIWRAMTESSIRELVMFLTTPDALSYSRAMRTLMPHGGSVFAVTVPLDSHDLLIGYIVVGPSKEDGSAALLDMTAWDPVQSAGISFNHATQRMVEVTPRDVDRQVAWFLLDVLGIDFDDRRNDELAGAWYRLRIPFPVPSVFFEPHFSNDIGNSIESFRSMLKVLQDFGTIGALWVTSKESAHIWIHDQTAEMLKVHKNKKFGTWHVQMVKELGRRPGDVSFELGTSRISLMDALKEAYVLWPEEDHEAFLDRVLVPGVPAMPQTLEAYALLGVECPFLLTPDELWALHEAATGV